MIFFLQNRFLRILFRLFLTKIGMNGIFHSVLVDRSKSTDSFAPPAFAEDDSPIEILWRNRRDSCYSSNKIASYFVCYLHCLPYLQIESGLLARLIDVIIKKTLFRSHAWMYQWTSYSTCIHKYMFIRIKYVYPQWPNCSTLFYLMSHDIGIRRNRKSSNTVTLLIVGYRYTLNFGTLVAMVFLPHIL